MKNREKFEVWFALAVGLGVLIAFLYLFLIKKDYFGGLLLMVAIFVLNWLIKQIFFSMKR